APNTACGVSSATEAGSTAARIGSYLAKAQSRPKAKLPNRPLPALLLRRLRSLLRPRHRSPKAARVSALRCLAAPRQAATASKSNPAKASLAKFLNAPASSDGEGIQCSV